MSIEKQAINESLLQSYRSIFISSQSIFLALGGLLLNKSNFLTLILALICLLQIWWIWFGVVYSRAKIVDFYKYSIGEKHNISEHDYVSITARRRFINRTIGIKTFRTTRIKIDIILPILYSVMWMGLAIFEYCND